jgi:molecular chaperone DnaJ
VTSHDWIGKDYYAILGVPRDAPDDAVKKAFRRLARDHHPDTNAGDPASERRFKRIGEAYAVLSDPESRPRYDALQPRIRDRVVFNQPEPSSTTRSGEELFGARLTLWWWQSSLSWSAPLWSSPVWTSSRR